VAAYQDGHKVEDTDLSHYLGVSVSIDVEKHTNGQDADDAPGPLVPTGDPLAWTYVVTNTGNVPLTKDTVTDDQGVTVTCPKDALAVDEPMTCNASGTATAGQYENRGTVEAYYEEQKVSDSDGSHYFGTTSGIDLEKHTNGQDADSPPGPVILAGAPVAWTYFVTNTGDVPLTNVTVTDGQGVVVTCPKTTLAAKEGMVCTATGVATAGQYENQGVVEAYQGSHKVEDIDLSHYLGVRVSIDLEKHTNGQDADDAPGPEIPVGEVVAWTYVVTNTGDVPLTNVTVSDDQGVTVDCPKDTLAIDDSMSCSATGRAVAGQYKNQGLVEAYYGSLKVSDADPSHYSGTKVKNQVHLPLVLRHK
jgi:hypothetical protein